MADTISVIREFFLDHSVDATDLDRSRDLLEEGVIDSLALMELVEFLRQRYSIEFEPRDLVAQNFKTLATIGTLVDGKVKSEE